MSRRRSCLHCGWLLCVLLLQSWFCSTIAAAGAAAKPLIYPLQIRERHIRGRSMLHTGSTVVQGDVHLGYHYATLQLGTPPKNFSVIIDTGSTITYVPCSGCKHCGPNHENVAFNPKASKTSSNVSCAADFCHKERNIFRCKEKSCYYYLGYAEMSSSAGWLIKDMYHFPDPLQDPVPVVFGCEDSETGEIYKQRADGLLGVSKGATAFHRQLTTAGASDDVFSICFGYPKGGAIAFGATELLTLEPMAFTPLVDRSPDYWNVKLERISVGDVKLDVPAAEWEYGYGVVLDSGTTFNYLPSATYRAFKKVIEEAMSKARMLKESSWDPNTPDICWSNGPDRFIGLEKELPTFKLQLKGGTILSWPPVRYLYYMNRGRYCLGIFDNRRDGLLIGALGARNLMIRFEVTRKRVGWAEANCTALGDAAAKGELHDEHPGTLPAHTAPAEASKPAKSPTPRPAGNSSSSTGAAAAGSSQPGSAPAAGGSAGSGAPQPGAPAIGEPTMSAEEAAAEAERIAGAGAGRVDGGGGAATATPPAVQAQGGYGWAVAVAGVIALVAVAAVVYTYRHPLKNMWLAKTGGFTQLTAADQDFEMAGQGAPPGFNMRVTKGLQSVSNEASHSIMSKGQIAASLLVRPLTPPQPAAAAAGSNSKAADGIELRPWQQPAAGNGHAAAVAAAAVGSPRVAMAPSPDVPLSLPVSVAAPRLVPLTISSPTRLASMVSIPLGPAWPLPDSGAPTPR